MPFGKLPHFCIEYFRRKSVFEKMQITKLSQRFEKSALIDSFFRMTYRSKIYSFQSHVPDGRKLTKHFFWSASENTFRFLEWLTR